MKIKINDTFVEFVKGDITEQNTDAIVNAANSALQLGGGVASAIRKRGGQKIQKECNRIGWCPVGGAVITGGGNFKAKYVTRAIGPRYGEGDEDEKLRNATQNSLEIADEKGLRNVAFPAASAGIFGFLMERCAEIMLSTTISYLKWDGKGKRKGKTSLKEVVFCLYSADAFEIFRRRLERERMSQQD